MKPIEPGTPLDEDNMKRVLIGVLILGVTAGLLFIKPETPDEIFAFIPLIVIILIGLAMAGKVKTSINKNAQAFKDKKPLGKVVQGAKTAADMKRLVMIIIGGIVILNALSAFIFGMAGIE